MIKKFFKKIEWEKEKSFLIEKEKKIRLRKLKKVSEPDKKKINSTVVKLDFFPL